MKKKAFTLAEVLITLTIIGVIAALTIPNLMQKWQDQQTLSAIKTARSIITNALKLTIQQEGVKDLSDLPWPKSGWYGENDVKYLFSILPIKYKDSTTIRLQNNYKKFAGSGNTSNEYIFSTGKSLENGMIVYFQLANIQNNNFWTTNQGWFPKVIIDINGPKGPNRWGYDVFLFRFTQNGDFATTGQNYNYCSLDTTWKWESGTSCGNWILKHNNVDYKYRDISKEW